MTRVSFVVFATLVACNKPPGPPVISITPADPSTGDDLQASIDAEAVDPNGDEVSYTYAWYQDGSVRTDLLGDTVPGSETSKGEAWRVVVVPSDGVLDGTADEAETLVLNTPPTCTVELAPDAPLTTDALTVITTGVDDDDDDVTFTYAWTVDGAVTEYDGDTVLADATTKGEVWEVTVTPEDDEEVGEALIADVTIDNTAPVVESVVLSPEGPREADVIEATAVASDDDGDAVTLSYAWSVDGVVVQEGEDATLTGELFDKHQEVTVSVTPDDGFTTGDAVESDAVTVLNTAPALDTASIDLTEVYEGSTVTCVPSGWQDDDGDAEAYEYAWTVNGVEVATSETLDGGSFDKHDVLACSVTPWDGEEAGETVTSDAVTVLNTAPTLASATLSSTSPVEGDTLSVTLAGESDDDGDDVSFTYAWYVGGVLAVATDTISSSQFDRGDEVYVVVTPTDGEDDGAPVTSDTATVQNTAPEVTSVSLSSSDVYTDDTITALVSTTDADGDSVSLSYSWTVGGTVVYTGGSSLDGEVYFDRDDVVAVTATPSDGSDDGAAVSSSSVTVLNTPPTAPLISIHPSDPSSDDDLVCQVDVDSEDADGDTVRYSFAWDVDEAAFSGASTTFETGDTVAAADTADGETWSCLATPNDGDDDGTAGEASVSFTMLGLDESNPGQSCQDVLDSNPSAADGHYWVTYGESTAFEVFCEMSTDDGGWGLAWEHDGITNFGSTSIAYDEPSVASSATEVLIAYVDENLSVSSIWASFAIPSDWQTQAPMSVSSATTTTDATIGGSSVSSVTLRYGYWDFVGSTATCSSFSWSSGVTSGAICIDHESAPWFGRFAADVSPDPHPSDACATGHAWDSYDYCSTSSRFAIFAR